jgi:indole-3-glycerol phosphate synthase
MPTVLESIIEGVRVDLADRKRVTPILQLQDKIAAIAPALPAAANLMYRDFSVIAEVKRSSPSKGDLAPISDPKRLANQYAEGGAKMISVLTERRRFSGSLADLVAVRSEVEIPILRKDFMVEQYQIFESRANGADAILLIMAALGDNQVSELNAIALELGMSVLVEVHDEYELDRALNIEPKLIGVNARNLKTLDVDLATCDRLLPLIPPAVVAIAESGISTLADIERLCNQGARGVLVGESLVKSGDPTETIQEWTEAGNEIVREMKGLA